MTKEFEDLAARLNEIFQLEEGACIAVRECITKFQRIHGLKEDGIVGPVTERFLDLPRFCRNPDRESIAGQLCRWDHTHWDGSKFVGEAVAMNLNYFVSEAAPAMTLSQTQTAVTAAFNEIASHAAVRFTSIANATGANIVLKFGQIDGPSSTLAYTELPCGPDTPQKLLDCLYDNAEPWVDSADPPNGRIDFRRVVIHEMLHFMGLEHGPTGAIMAPYYDKSIRTLQAWDIDQLQKRYGPPAAAPPPVIPPVVPPGPAGQATCNVQLPNGQRWYGPLQSLSG